jgi:hypothetical protein
LGGFDLVDLLAEDILQLFAGGGFHGLGFIAFEKIDLGQV